MFLKLTSPHVLSTFKFDQGSEDSSCQNFRLTSGVTSRRYLPNILAIDTAYGDIRHTKSDPPYDSIFIIHKMILFGPEKVVVESRQSNCWVHPEKRDDMNLLWTSSSILLFFHPGLRKTNKETKRIVCGLTPTRLHSRKPWSLLVRTSRASCYSKSQAPETGKSCRSISRRQAKPNLTPAHMWFNSIISMAYFQLRKRTWTISEAQMPSFQQVFSISALEAMWKTYKYIN